MQTLAGFFRDGGMFMYFILAVFVTGMAMVVERAYILIHKYNINARALWEKISKLIMAGELDRVQKLCGGSDAPLLKILNAGVSAADATDREIQNAIDEVSLEVIPLITKRIAYLSTLANVATLLGLLGTIQGLVQAFSAVGSAEPSQKAALLAGGQVSGTPAGSLFTPATFGLIVAIPILVMYTILQVKAHKITDEIDEFSVKLINLLDRRRNGLQAK